MSTKRAASNLSLVGFDDIFNVGTKDNNIEHVEMIDLDKLHTPELHPFQIKDDDAMQSLVMSIQENGVREPGLARPRKEGGYELLCGNRRKRACELSGLLTMPVIIREMDTDSAVIAMVDSNLQHREKILLSEKAWAYRIKMEALNHNGVKGDNHSFEIMVNQTGESKNQIFRLIRLTELITTLIDKVDNKQLAFNPAVELSYLSITEQTKVADAMVMYDVKPSLSQAVRLKKAKVNNLLTSELIEQIISEDKKSLKKNQIKNNPYYNYFPNNYSSKQIDEVIIKLLTKWQSGTMTL